jgi:hypothetical protein
MTVSDYVTVTLELCQYDKGRRLLSGLGFPKLSASEDQLRVVSTILFLPIQGIMARRRAPTSSI